MTLGRLITLEGGEGTGKSTQSAKLRETLGERGISAIVTREPGGAPLAEKLRNLILEGQPQAPNAEFLMFAAARCEHLATTIKPALVRGDWVICDRYIDSTRVYQGEIAGISQDLIVAVEQFCVAPWFPDLTVVLDLPVDLAAPRIAARGSQTRFDSATLTHHEAIRQGFLDIAEREPERCAVISANGSVETVASQLFDVVSERLLIKTGDGSKA